MGNTSRLGACAVVLACLAGCSSDAAAPPPPRLEWHECEDVALRAGQCATLAVSRDHVELALYRVAARGPRIGTIIVNPGGPGGSGLQHLAGVGDAFPPGFDIVTFDPRGVGASRPAAVDLAGAIGSVDVARDIDEIRAALGEEQISYVGFSYGTRLGWTYAAMFPDRVRAMVLDGPEDPLADWAQSTLQQADALEQLLGSFVEFCATDPDATCPPDPRAAIAEVIRTAEEHPIRTVHAATPLDGVFALNAVISAFYDDRTWPDLGRALTKALDGDGTRLIELSFFWSEQRSKHPYVSADAQAMIWCADHPERLTAQDVERVRAEVADRAPTFAPWFPDAVPPCLGEPVDDEFAPKPGWTGTTPILVVAATGDVATPIIGAHDLVDALGNATLLVRDGDGHTSYLLGNACIDAAVERYLTDLVVPADTACS